MDPVHDGGSMDQVHILMDPVHGGGPWTGGHVLYFPFFKYPKISKNGNPLFFPVMFGTVNSLF